MDEALNEALSLMDEKKAAYVVTPNPEIVMLCRQDESLNKAVAGAALVLPDGIGIIYGAKILGTPMKQKLPGIDFFNGAFRKMPLAGKNAVSAGRKAGGCRFCRRCAKRTLSRS